MKLLTSSNAQYLPKMRRYLVSLANHSPFDNVILGAGCHIPAEFIDDLLGVRSIDIPATALMGSPKETQSLQHGSWLNFVSGDDSEIVIYTDGDIILQRRPDAHDLIFFDNLQMGGIGCGYNSGQGETLWDEAFRLGPKKDLAGEFSNWIDRWGDITKICSYNVGVIAARRDVWRQIYSTYMENWAAVNDYFSGPARQQWLINWTIARLGLPVYIMPHSIHTHGCYTLPVGHSWNEYGTLSHAGKMVLFRHHV